MSNNNERSSKSNIVSFIQHPINYRDGLPRRGRAIVNAGFVAMFGIAAFVGATFADKVTGHDAPKICIDTAPYIGKTPTHTGKNALKAMGMDPGTFATGTLGLDLRDAYDSLDAYDGLAENKRVILCANEEHGNFSLHNKIPIGDGFELYLGNAAASPN